MDDLAAFGIMMAAMGLLVTFIIGAAIITKERRERNYHLMRGRCPDCFSPCFGITEVEDRGYGDIAVRKWNCEHCGFSHEVL